MRRIFISMLIAASLWAVPAHAASSSAWVEQGRQWVNVSSCDSASHTVGVRASQAGDALGRRMFSRFSLQWFSAQQNDWVTIPAAGSGWLAAGAGPWVSYETGWNQAFAPAPAGATFRIRGVVEMQWREGSGVKRSATLVSAECSLR